MSVMIMSAPIRPCDVRSVSQAYETREAIEWCSKKGRLFHARVISKPRWDFDIGAPGFVIDLELLDAETVFDVIGDARASMR